MHVFPSKRRQNGNGCPANAALRPFSPYSDPTLPLPPIASRPAPLSLPGRSSAAGLPQETPEERSLSVCASQMARFLNFRSLGQFSCKTTYRFAEHD